ncbi:MAG: UPF0261 family protein [Deltaproteobacteria bacterium]|nr:MAG: UPF0261 family protein [Deltaproteobacteria bacterium]
MAKSTILVISTLDTKAQETLYLKEKIRESGSRPILMDLSMGTPDAGVPPAEIPAAEVARAGGSHIEEIRNSRERAKITAIMIEGAKKLAKDAYEKGEVQGVIGLGGSTGSLMATEVMRALPFGMAKLMVSSTAALPGLSTRYIGKGDIALFHTVIEIAGLSNLLKQALDRSASAICAMAQIPLPARERDKDQIVVALTMLGPCEHCASAVRKRLESDGCQVIGFSAAGISDAAMEDMVRQKLFDAVIDLAPGGVGEALWKGMRASGPHRMEAAGDVGIPQVIAPCSVNFMTPRKSQYKPEYYERRKVDLDKHRTWIRISPEEMEAVAKAFAEKLNKAKGPVHVVIPTKGWSAVDREGSPAYDPKEDAIFTKVLKKELKNGRIIREVDANLEDPSFAEAVVAAFWEVVDR